MEAWRQMLSQFRDLVNGLGPVQRLTLVVVPLLVLAALGLGISAGKGEEEVALLAGKSFTVAEMAAAREALGRAGFTQFHVEGSQILVSPTEVARYDAALTESGGFGARGSGTSGSGVTGTGGGRFSDRLERALGANPLLTGNSQRQEMIEFAKAEEVADMIRRNPHIADARIIGHRTRGRGFASEERRTATISVTPRRGVELPRGLYRSLQQMAAGALSIPEQEIAVFNTETGETVTGGPPQPPENRAATVAVGKPAAASISPREPLQQVAVCQQQIAAALAHIPQAIITVSPELPAGAARITKGAGNSRIGADADPFDETGAEQSNGPAVHVSVAIPEEHCRSLVLGAGRDESKPRAFGAQLQRMRARVAEEVRKAVVPLAVAGGIASEPVVNVSYYERVGRQAGKKAASASGKTTVGPAISTMSARELIEQWGGAAGVAVCCVCGLLALRRRQRDRIEPVASVAQSANAVTRTAASGSAAEAEVNDPAEGTDTMGSDPSADEVSADELSTEELPVRFERSAARPFVREASATEDRRRSVPLSREAHKESALRDEHASADPFEFLHQARAESVLSFVTDEHPQTIALILSRLPGPLAEQVLRGLPSTQRLEVAHRVAHLEPIQDEVVQDVASGLRARVTGLQTGERPAASQPVPNTRSSAEIPGRIGHGSNGAVATNRPSDLPGWARDQSGQIKRMMFVFDDLLELDAEAISPLFSRIDASKWALALKGASDELNTKIFENLPPAAAARLKAELRELGPVRVGDVAAAQQQIVDMIRRTEDAGEVVMGPRRDGGSALRMSV